MSEQRVKEVIAGSAVGASVEVRGWVRTKRETKNVVFFEVNDGSSLANLQVVVDREESVPEEIIDDVATGASVEVAGIIVDSPGNQPVELHANSVTVVGHADQEIYPLQKKRHSFEFLREIAHLRPRTNTFGCIARVRNAMNSAVHDFFQARGFLFVHTPVISTSDAEGAGEMFQVTTLDLEELAKSGSLEYANDFFGKRAALTVSGQLEAEVFALAFTNVYTFGPTFRAEHSNTTRHLAEFWMIEPEMAFCDIECDMDVAEEFLKHLLDRVLTRCADEMAFFERFIEKGLVDSLRSVTESTFARISYGEAIEELRSSGADFEFPAEWGGDLQTEHEKYLTEVVHGGPVIVTDYPKQIKAFYMKQNSDGKTVRAMDVLVPRLGEIIGGSQREDSQELLLARIEELGLDPADYWWYLELRKFGSVPHSGFGLGFERLVQYVTGMQNIRDVIPFPRALDSADF